MNGINTWIALVHVAMRRAGCPVDDEGRKRVALAFETAAREQYGGQTVHTYVNTMRTERVEREQRIEAALSAGEAPESIAKREDVSKRHMRRIRARFA